MTYPTNLQLHTDGHPILRRHAEPVTEFDTDLLLFTNEMTKMLTPWKGCGLAAPQVGVSKRIIVIRWKERDWTLINPVLTGLTGSMIHEEGCLSVPGVRGLVSRPRRFEVHYQTVVGAKAKKFFNDEHDYLAAIVQHEVDHLNGVLFTDKMIKKTGNAPARD